MLDGNEAPPYGPAAFENAARARNCAIVLGKAGSIDMPDPDDLRALGSRLEKARRQTEPRKKEAPPSSLGIASRFATEMLVAVIFGGGLGWLLDRWLGTKPILLVVMFLLGAAAGIRNVMHAAAEINAKSGAAPDTDDEEK